MSQIIGRGALAGILGLSMAVAPLLARDLNPRPKRVTLSGRIVAKVPTEGFTTVGLNYTSYVFEVENRKQEASPQLIKVSYRFLIREPQLPTSLFDYSLMHKFRMTRDEGCDESWGDVSTRFIFDNEGELRGKLEDVVYARNAPALHLEAQSTLPCYVVTPRDYESTKSVKLLPGRQSAGANQSSGKRAAGAEAATPEMR